MGGFIDVLQSAVPVASVIYNGQRKQNNVYATLEMEMGNCDLTPAERQPQRSRQRRGAREEMEVRPCDVE